MRAIIAVNSKNTIGLNGGLPWKCKEDLKHFKRLTINCNLLCGYNTLLTLPPLKNRLVWEAKDRIINLIETSSLSYENCWVIGGKKTYEKMCHLFTELHISHISDDTIGDTLYPDLINLNPDCKIFHYYFDVDK